MTSSSLWPQTPLLGRSRPAWRCAVLVFVLALLALPKSAGAQQRLEWSPDWRRVGVPEYAAIGALFAGHGIIHYGVGPAQSPLWTRPLLLDTQIRELLVARSRAGRRLTAVVSDSVALLSLAQPLVIDSIIVAGVTDQNSDVAWQLQVISLQSYAATLLLNTAAKRVFARQRPYGVMCAADPEYTECEDLDRFRSFYSGHSAITATSAGLVCSHHTHLPLYGGGVADGVACGAAVLGTLATGALRIASDRHWATDVFVGHLLGFGVGFALPSLVYYKRVRAKPASDNSALAPPPQLTYSGQF